MHEAGFKMAINREINKYARMIKLLKMAMKIFNRDAAIDRDCAVKHPNPQYEGQTKSKLEIVRLPNHKPL